MGEHLAYEDPVGEYIVYLGQYTRNKAMSLWQVHQLLRNRVIAKEYGVTNEQLLWLDENL